MTIIFWLSLILILHTFIFYPVSLYLINKFIKKSTLITSNNYQPEVSFIIAAHNEEKVIKMKLENVINLNYDFSKLEVIVASDNSADNTNQIVEEFISEHQGEDIPDLKLYIVKDRKGKTNAQNEAVKEAQGEIIAFSDANTIWEKDALEKLIAGFKDQSIGYICGRLQYVNDYDNITAESESTYWNYDLKMRGWESNIASVTAGNGAIYAIRKNHYEDLNPIKCHDSAMPTVMVLKNKKAKYLKEAIAYEKAGENTSDEFKRKVRMFRVLPWNVFEKVSKYNPFKTGWFSYFYFSHRTLRYSLYLLHVLLLISNVFLWNQHWIYNLTLMGQLSFYSLAFIGALTKLKSKLFYSPYFYTMTITAQLIAVIKSFLGKNKAVWDKAESTR
ncbi:cellulose synthase/poly-beta-1,6-N-acetylglucosamine synthase-like glycosyltransferase [Halanaerobium saccharolyticum]|uniref:Cellulose synthase/poly-beta-1,6-N-acetylglucosamine synthase-like glycosyltransferase n=1 Tax=Halanaerobium saccharolyticum TaxID=43595 RepID=A0A4R6R772_9FIRM|nr:glycosyltransferase family 2 protein [Halanaerobium saccharolyticum]TDP81565.1 cellulose synthase/poly-beta-1,6-N-acetylglucosamine synthase-like glycosyltransferase [Halanaerobium saccharolyticum]